MTRTLGLVPGATALSLAAAAALLTVPDQAGSFYTDTHEFFANRLVPAMNEICTHIAEQTLEMPQ